MQDNWQEFDRQMKSVLQDAGEKAPRRVWRAVSARLDSAAAAALWWRWAVPALVAAAVVAGLFLTGTFGSRTSGAGDVDILAVATDPQPSGEISVSEAVALLDEPAPEQIAPVSARRASVRPVRTGSEEAAPETAPAEEDEAIAPAANRPAANMPSSNEAEAAPADNGAATAEGKKATESVEASDNAAVWARIEQEEQSHRREGVRLRNMYAQGSVGGNDSNLSYGGNGISRLAPGAGSVDAGISEAGQSTYGVPFTVGLGVRLGLGSKLSVGTGLDYSLLTRTFQGSYTGSAASAYEGRISHSVSYLGVPVNIYYDLFRTRDDLINIYVWGGGEAEWCLSNSYRLMNSAFTAVTDKAGGFQYSAAAGLGMEFRLSEVLGLYADPSVRYYFHGEQPKSIRTDKPFMFNFNAGLRFNF